MRLKYGMSLLWTGPQAAAVYSGSQAYLPLNDLQAKEYELLSTWEEGISRSGYYYRAQRLGIARTRATELLHRARQAQVFSKEEHPRASAGAIWERVANLDQNDLQQRHTKQVAIARLEGVGTLVAMLLARAGVGKIAIAEHETALSALPGGLEAQYCELPPRGALQAQCRAEGLNTLITTDLEEADLLVLPSWATVDIPLVTETMQRDQAHLPIIGDDTAVLVGPLVRPGQGPCLECVELSRARRDPLWNSVSLQLRLRPSARSEAISSAIAAHLAVSQILAFLDGREVPTGHRQRVEANGCVTTTYYRPDPACGCQGLPELPELPYLRAGAYDWPGPSSPSVLALASASPLESFPGSSPTA